MTVHSVCAWGASLCFHKLAEAAERSARQLVNPPRTTFQVVQFYLQDTSFSLGVRRSSRTSSVSQGFRPVGFDVRKAGRTSQNFDLHLGHLVGSCARDTHSWPHRSQRNPGILIRATLLNSTWRRSNLKTYREKIQTVPIRWHFLVR